ncbi:MAG: hypothetical protein KJP00_12260, partial [Bacteroidia bacterium]|nr:hypothetical protein [Bacteroidia bacterium]
ISAAPAMLSSAIPGSGGMPGYATLSPALAPLVGAPSLPPPPPPPLVNTLSSNTYYRFTVNAELLEYNYGTLTWSTVIKSDGQPLTDSVIKTFRTGPMEPVTILSGSLSTY